VFSVCQRCDGEASVEVYSAQVQIYPPHIKIEFRKESVSFPVLISEGKKVCTVLNSVHLLKKQIVEAYVYSAPNGLYSVFRISANYEYK
jgi:hypothetical protein